MTEIQRMSRGREIQLISTSRPLGTHHSKDKPACKHQSSSSRTATDVPTPVPLASTGAAPMPREPKAPAVRGPLREVRVTNKMAKASSQQPSHYRLTYMLIWTKQKWEKHFKASSVKLPPKSDFAYHYSPLDSSLWWGHMVFSGKKWNIFQTTKLSAKKRTAFCTLQN